MVQDLKNPCATGIGLLNELLDFEKADSGLTVLDRSMQDPCDFIELTVNPFAMVARQKRIRMELRNGIERNTTQVDIDEAKVSTNTLINTQSLI